MTTDNSSIWIPSHWNAKRQPFEIICEDRELAWCGIVTRVDTVLTDHTQVLVVIQAVGSNPKKPSECDVANAELSALVVSQQRWRNLRRKEIRALLKFPHNCRVEVDVDLNTTKRRLKEYFANSRQPRFELPLPTPVLSYLMTR
jgi:hypothetical protein